MTGQAIINAVLSTVLLVYLAARYVHRIEGKRKEER
jgi:hypothetical protein